MFYYGDILSRTCFYASLKQWLLFIIVIVISDHSGSWVYSEYWHNLSIKCCGIVFKCSFYELVLVWSRIHVF